MQKMARGKKKNGKNEELIRITFPATVESYV